MRSYSLFALLLWSAAEAGAAGRIHVLVWDEQQPEQKKAYENFLGNEIARYLQARADFEVRSVRLDDPEQGLSKDNLDWAHVLIWWGHRRHEELAPGKSQQIVRRIMAGELALIAVHAAHWSQPFMDAMNERTRQDARIRYPDPRTVLEFIPAPGRSQPTYDSLLTPAYLALQRSGVATRVRVDLPLCVFPGVRADGKPSKVTVKLPDHPIAKGIPPAFEIPQTEMYNEPFHVPPPDELVMEEHWPAGEWFRSAMVWNVGKGKVFYFRPGHETYPVFKQEIPRRILENAARWLGRPSGS